MNKDFSGHPTKCACGFYWVSTTDHVTLNAGIIQVHGRDHCFNYKRDRAVA